MPPTPENRQPADGPDYPPPPPRRRRGSKRRRRRNVRVAAVVTMIAAVAIVALLGWKFYHDRAGPSDIPTSMTPFR